MHISEKRQKEFKRLYTDRYGVSLSKKEALDKALNLLNLVNAVYEPLLSGNENICEEKAG